MRGRVAWVEKVNVTCSVCSTVVVCHPSIAKTKKFCSRKCKHASVRGVPNLALKGRRFPERLSEGTPTWKGDKASYSAIHHWMKSNFGTPMECETCGFKTDNTRHIQWANLSGEYKRVRSDWKRLCVPCHAKLDGKSEMMKGLWRDGRIKSPNKSTV